MSEQQDESFARDRAFLEDRCETCLLQGDEPGQVIVSPEWQCRVLTSTTGRGSAASLGFLNYQQIENPPPTSEPAFVGGEDRIWLAPEGSRFSFYFPPDSELDFRHWRVPQAIDRMPFVEISRSKLHLEMQARFRLSHRERYGFEIRVDRRLHWHSRRESAEVLGVMLPDSLGHVSHSSDTVLVNNGESSWTRQTGLPAIWSLGMFRPSPAVVIVVPVRTRPGNVGSSAINAAYFGPPGRARLRYLGDRSVYLFRGDGQFRSKIGLTAECTTSTLGAWNPETQTLTLVVTDDSPDRNALYTNNLWTTEGDPFGGDKVNAYNDGPNESGGMLGPFFELETLSPTAPCQPGESIRHRHRTIHIDGDRQALNSVALRVLGVDLALIESAF